MFRSPSWTLRNLASRGLCRGPKAGGLEFVKPRQEQNIPFSRLSGTQDTRDGAIRCRRTTKIAQQNPIRGIPESGGEAGTRGTAKEAAPCRESRRRNQGCGLVWPGCPVNSNRAIMGGYVVRPDSVIVPFNCQGRASCTPDCFPSGYRMRDALIPDKSESE